MKYIQRFCVMICSITLYAFNGWGQNGTSLINNSPSARTNALANSTIALSDEDVLLVLSNPSSLNQAMKNQLSFSHSFHFADISYGNLYYGIMTDTSHWMFAAGFSYINYGEFVRTDIIGNQLGEFKGRHNVASLTFARKLNERVYFGSSLKMSNTVFDGFGSFSFLGDIGIQYRVPGNRTIWAFVFRNAGFQLSGKNELKDSHEADIEFGFSKELEHLPFRYMISFHRLQQWNLRTDESDRSDPIFSGPDDQETSPVSVIVDNLFRHLKVGGELSLGANKNLQLRIGYDHLLNKDLAVSGFRSFNGFSAGFGVRVKKFNFDYSFSRYHLAGASNHLALRIDLSELFSKL